MKQNNSKRRFWLSHVAVSVVASTVAVGLTLWISGLNPGDGDEQIMFEPKPMGVSGIPPTDAFSKNLCSAYAVSRAAEDFLFNDNFRHVPVVLSAEGFGTSYGDIWCNVRIGYQLPSGSRTEPGRAERDMWFHLTSRELGFKAKSESDFSNAKRARDESREAK